MSNLTQQLNLKSSFSKKDVLAICTSTNIDVEELKLRLANINKTMLGRQAVLDLIFELYISTYTDYTGPLHTPDQLLSYILKEHPYTCTGEALTKSLKDIWTEINPDLKKYSIGFNLTKELIIYLYTSLGKKPTTGCRQISETFKLKTIELYSKL